MILPLPRLTRGFRPDAALLSCCKSIGATGLNFIFASPFATWTVKSTSRGHSKIKLCWPFSPARLTETADRRADGSQKCQLSVEGIDVAVHYSLSRM